MLQENKFKMFSVVTVKFANGEELIGGYLSENETTVTIRKPLALAVTQNGPSLAPYFMTADVLNEQNEIVFARHHIMAMVATHKNFASAYTQATSGLTITDTGASSKFVM